MHNFPSTHVASASNEALKRLSDVSGEPLDGYYPTTRPKLNQKEEEDKIGTGRPADPSCESEDLLGMISSSLVSAMISHVFPHERCHGVDINMMMSALFLGIEAWKDM